MTSVRCALAVERAYRDHYHKHAMLHIDEKKKLISSTTNEERAYDFFTRLTPFYDPWLWFAANPKGVSILRLLQEERVREVPKYFNPSNYDFIYTDEQTKAEVKRFVEADLYARVGSYARFTEGVISRIYHSASPMMLLNLYKLVDWISIEAAQLKMFDQTGVYTSLLNTCTSLRRLTGSIAIGRPPFFQVTLDEWGTVVTARPGSAHSSDCTYESGEAVAINK